MGVLVITDLFFGVYIGASDLGKLPLAPSPWLHCGRLSSVARLAGKAFALLSSVFLSAPRKSLRSLQKGPFKDIWGLHIRLSTLDLISEPRQITHGSGGIRAERNHVWRGF